LPTAPEDLPQAVSSLTRQNEADHSGTDSAHGLADPLTYRMRLDDIQPVDQLGKTRDSAAVLDVERLENEGDLQSLSA
jgi:hypothetical protein